MNENVWRLTCQFDVYETLVDILKHDYGEKRSASRRFPLLLAGTERKTRFNRGISLFREVPLNRTCDDAGIPLHFCVCQQEEAVDVTLPLVKEATNVVIETIQKVNRKCKYNRQ